MTNPANNAASTEWVRGMSYSKRSNDHGVFFLISGLAHDGTSKTISASEKVAHHLKNLLKSIDEGRQPWVPIIPKDSNGLWYKVDLNLVYAEPPQSIATINPVAALLRQSSSSTGNQSHNQIKTKLRQQFHVSHEIVEQAEYVAAQKRVNKGQLYADAVTHFLALEACANSVGI